MPGCGSLAQLVEQRPEEPCVPSSSLGGATTMNFLDEFGNGFVSCVVDMEEVGLWLDSRRRFGGA